MQFQQKVRNEAPSIQAVSSDSFDKGTTSGIRLHHLDSLRGLAALAVVILHAFEMFGLGFDWAGIHSEALLNGGADRIISFVYYNGVSWGAMAVELFIVLSGYSLMIGVARSANGRSQGGLLTYFKRRIRRIWPPYYAALFLSLFLIITIPGMNQKANVYWDLALPITPDSLLAHMLFIQHLNPEWFFKINPPMWTVAIEEWIYVLFPFLLLPVWRRFGSLIMVAVGISVGVAASYLFPSLLQSANPWYLGLFAMGALGASIGFSTRASEQRWRTRLPWFTLSLGLLGAFVLLTLVIQRTNLGLGDITWSTDIIFGAGISCLLIHYTEVWRLKNPRRISFFRVLNQPILIKLGRFSYSLYLLHAPILALVSLAIRNTGLTSFSAYAAILMLGVPAALLYSYLFHRIFERPFMLGKQSLLAAKPEPADASSLVQPNESSL